jgi:RimJ/RimL family protein N-acetyltransferase
MVLHSIAHDDPEIEKWKERISDYTKQIEAFGFTYRVYLNEEQLVGIAVIGKEPMQLFKPVGTPLIQFRVLDYEQPVEVLNKFADTVLELATEREVDYAYLNIPVEQERLAAHLEQIGFQELANRYNMRRSLDDSVEVSNRLRYEQIRREDVKRFFEYMKEFMSGSPDAVLSMVIANFKNIPEVIMDAWFKGDEAYLVYHDDEVIGILDLVPPEGFIQNIGVSPMHRGKGFGTEMLRFCLKLFKDAGNEEAGLGVHVNNGRAIHVYEKLGFSVERQIQTYIWWKPG